MLKKKHEQVNKRKDFRLRAKTMFLTYPQLPAGVKDRDIVEAALERYRTVFKSTFNYVIAIELHEDGNPHLHAFLKFDKVQKIYSATKLDFVLTRHDQIGAEIAAHVCHGKYEATKSQHKVVQYLLKDVVGDGEIFTNMKLPIVDNVYYSDPYEHLYAVMLKDGYSAAIRELYHRYPKEATLKGNTICANLMRASHYLQDEDRLKARVEYDLNDFTELPESVLEWLTNESHVPLILYGGSGFGKTALAKSLMSFLGKKYMIVSDINDLKEFHNSDFNAIIFDDLNLENLTREQIVHLVDVEEDRHIRVLYGTARVPSSTSKIFTLNYINPLTRNNDRAIVRRVQICKISKPVYKLPDKQLNKLIESNEEIHPVIEYINSTKDNMIDISVNHKSKDDKKDVDTIDITAPKKRKRGRPKGSKNKSKIEVSGKPA